MDINDTPSVNRRQVSRRTRFEILRRDGFRCRYCGATQPENGLVVDHVIPVALGGSDDPSNLTACCRDCNAGKASTSPDEHHVAQVDAMAEQYAAAVRQAAEQRRAVMASEEDALHRFYGIAYDIMGSDAWLTPGWEVSIARFMSAGLSVEDLKHFVYAVAGSSASTGGAFRYFCACCWNEIRDREQLALRMLKGGR